MNIVSTVTNPFDNKAGSLFVECTSWKNYDNLPLSAEYDGITFVRRMFHKERCLAIYLRHGILT